jgi:hypothetical protein
MPISARALRRCVTSFWYRDDYNLETNKSEAHITSRPVEFKYVSTYNSKWHIYGALDKHVHEPGMSYEYASYTHQPITVWMTREEDDLGPGCICTKQGKQNILNWGMCLELQFFKEVSIHRITAGSQLSSTIIAIVDIMLYSIMHHADDCLFHVALGCAIYNIWKKNNMKTVRLNSMPATSTGTIHCAKISVQFTFNSHEKLIDMYV